MDMTKIEAFLTHLEKTRRRLTARELEQLYTLAFYPDPLIRSDVAALLVDHYEEKSEEVLLRLTYDSDSLVRTDAVDSLCIGRREATLERLIHLIEYDSEYTVRGFAAHSAYDVFVNMFGDSDKTHQVVCGVLEPLLQKERNRWVHVCYFCVLYLSGKYGYLQHLLDCLDSENYYVRSMVLNAFEDILDERSSRSIEEALQNQLSFEENESLVRKIEELLLLIDEDQQNTMW